MTARTKPRNRPRGFNHPRTMEHSKRTKKMKTTNLAFAMMLLLGIGAGLFGTIGKILGVSSMDYLLLISLIFVPVSIAALIVCNFQKIRRLIYRA